MSDISAHHGTVVVLTALDLEYQAVRGHLDEPCLRRHQTGTLFEVGALRGTSWHVALAVTGEGSQRAAILAERAIAMFDPVVLLFVGVAGALMSDIELGDVVVATRVYGYHGGKEEGGEFLARPRAWDIPHHLDQLARHIGRTGRWQPPPLERVGQRRPAVHFRPVAAGEVVVNSLTSPLAEQIRRHYNDAAAVEMESAGVAQAAHLNLAPVLVVRGISDHADGGKYEADGAGWQPVAAAHAAAFAIALLAELSVPQPAAPALATDPAHRASPGPQSLIEPVPTVGPAAGDTSQPVPDASGLAGVADNVVEELAQAVAEQWRKEEERTGVQDPRPLPVRWKVTEGAEAAMLGVRWDSVGVARPQALTGEFDDIGTFYSSSVPSRRLVILGQAGAGKTVLAVRLLRKVLAARRRGEPVPVLFSLGAWDPAEFGLLDWMVVQLIRDFPALGAKVRSLKGRATSRAAVLVNTHSVIPVLDGLDEVAEPLRAAAIDAINRLGLDLPLVVTARIDEYQQSVRAAGRGLSGAAVVELQQVDLVEVRRYLADAAPDSRAGGSASRWQPVFAQWDDDPGGPVAQALQVPLMAWLARVAYRQPTTDPGELCDRVRFPNRDAVEGHLLDHFVSASYPSYPTPRPPGGGDRRWRQEDAQRWLAFLARHLRAIGTSDFSWWQLHRAVPGMRSTMLFLTGFALGFGGCYSLIGFLSGSYSLFPVACGTVAGIGLGLVLWSKRALAFILSLIEPAPDGEPPRQATTFRGFWHETRQLFRQPRDMLKGFAIWNAPPMVAYFLIDLAQRSGSTAAQLSLSLVSILLFLGWAGWCAWRFARWFMVCWRRFCRGEMPAAAVADDYLIDLSRAASPISTLRRERRSTTIPALVFIPVGALLYFIISRKSFNSIGQTGPDPMDLMGFMGACVLPAFLAWLLVGSHFAFAVTRFFLALSGRAPWATMAFLADAHARGVLRQVGAVYQFRHARLADQLAQRR